MTGIRHFTSTGYIAYRGRVLLHWHRKLQMWMPPGGHIEPNEDPVEAIIREAEEETGIRVTVWPTGRRFRFKYPAQVTTPLAILEEDIDDPVHGPHKHIDFIYVLRPVAPPPEHVDGWIWVTRDALAGMRALESPTGAHVKPAEDVAELGLVALDEAEKWPL
ncbi:MAG: NUDIX domain-containing protein [SAR202 cluster bacterium]|nr:NUDIX domain-containing protein [SAR202 cluster bacterium]